MKKAIITAALTGSIHTPSMSPYLPITASQLIDEILAVHEAGGAVALSVLKTRQLVSRRHGMNPEASYAASAQAYRW